MNIQHKLVPATYEMYGHTVCMAQVGKYPTQLHFDEGDKFNVQMGSSQFPWYAEGFHMPDGDIAIDAMAIRSDLTPCEGCYPSLDRIDWASATINVATSLKDNADEPDMIVIMELEDDKLDKENELSIEMLLVLSAISQWLGEEAAPEAKSEIWARNYIRDGYPMTKELRNISYVCEGDYTFYKTATWSNHSGWHGFTHDGDEHLITQEGMLAWDEKIS